MTFPIPPTLHRFSRHILAAGLAAGLASAASAWRLRADDIDDSVRTLVEAARQRDSGAAASASGRTAAAGSGFSDKKPVPDQTAPQGDAGEAAGFKPGFYSFKNVDPQDDERVEYFHFRFEAPPGSSGKLTGLHQRFINFFLTDTLLETTYALHQSRTEGLAVKIDFSKDGEGYFLVGRFVGQDIEVLTALKTDDDSTFLPTPFPLRYSTELTGEFGQTGRRFLRP